MIPSAYIKEGTGREHQQSLRKKRNMTLCGRFLLYIYLKSTTIALAGLVSVFGVYPLVISRPSHTAIEYALDDTRSSLSLGIAVSRYPPYESLHHLLSKMGNIARPVDRRIGARRD